MPIYITRGEEPTGPYSFDEVREFLAEGSLLPTDLAWHEGLENWIPLSELVGQSAVPESVPPPSAPVVTEPVPVEQVPAASVAKPRYRKELLTGIGAGMGVLVIAGAVWFGFFRPDGSNQEERRVAHVGEPKDMESSKPAPSKTNAPVVPVNPQPVVTNAPVIPINPQPVVTNTPVVPVNPQLVVTNAPVIPIIPQPVETNAPVVPVTPQPVVTNAPAGPVNPGGNAKPKPLSPKFLAMIMSHNANLDFYVINIGSDKGLKKGQKLTVFRNGKDIGKIEVTRVQPLVSIVVPDKAFPKPSSPFKLGDKVMGGFATGPIMPQPAETNAPVDPVKPNENGKLKVEPVKATMTPGIGGQDGI